MLRRLLCTLLFVCCIVACGHAQSRVECNVLNSRILKDQVRYCVFLPPSYDLSHQRYPVLYFLHGLGDNEQSLINLGGWNVVNELRREQKIGDFLIVAPDGGRTFFIDSADKRVRYSEFFLREVMPFIERTYRIRASRNARGISGISMGGYGALRFAFAYPQLFSSVSAQSAALVTDSPEQMNTAMQSGLPIAKVMGAVFGDPISIVHWKLNNPFTLARQNGPALRKLSIYFNCGNDDDYGFENGAAALHKQLVKQGIRHEYHLYPGRHDLTYFLTHFGETMEFHWRAFAAPK